MSQESVNMDMFTCPISMEVMTDPVIAPDGHTYEREAIVHWIHMHHNSPLTRISMEVSQLLPNFAVKSAIETLKKAGVKMEKENVLERKYQAPYKVVAASYGDKTLVRFVPPNRGNRTPCSIVCVLDVSGSMQLDATENKGDEASRQTLSRLDLVKHSVKTVIGNLNETDSLAIVTFSNAASVISPMQHMTPVNKEQSIEKLEAAVADGSTNLWDGIRVGMSLTDSVINANSNVVVLVFTDGEPTDSTAPPRGLWPSLCTLLSKPGRSTLHTFGFGYKLDSKLLADIAAVGNGVYAYLPDASMIGTVFVNFLSYVLTTATTTRTCVQRLDDIESRLKIGTIQFGQDRTVLLNYPKDEVRVFYGTESVEVTKVENFEDSLVCFDLVRIQFLEEMDKFLKSESQVNFAESANSTQYNLKVLFENAKRYNDERISRFYRDIQSENDQEAQIIKAISREDWFHKWGKHYLRALISAHHLQFRCNFKDQGVQVYGGEMFEEYQTAADELFCTMPPPQPAVDNFDYDRWGQGGNVPYQPRAPVNMADYMNNQGGCFSGDALVLLSDGKRKKVSEIRKGDTLSNGTVECVVMTTVTNPQLVRILNSFEISPYHPIKTPAGNNWVFPISIGTVVPSNVCILYDFVLDTRKHFDINGFTVASWGHGCSDNDVIYHPFYGTERVIDRLKQHTLYHTGSITLKQDCANSRDFETGFVDNFSF